MSLNPTTIIDYFRKIHIAFLIAIITIISLILFIPEEIAKTLAVNEFRKNYRIFLGPLRLLTIAFLITRIFLFIAKIYSEKKKLKVRYNVLYNLTPEEKGYLSIYITEQKNSITVGLDDGIMGGLELKNIVYRATNEGSILIGFPFNLQPWIREYLNKKPKLLEGAIGDPKTPRQILHDSY